MAMRVRVVGSLLGIENPERLLQERRRSVIPAFVVVRPSETVHAHGGVDVFSPRLGLAELHSLFCQWQGFVHAARNPECVPQMEDGLNSVGVARAKNGCQRFPCPREQLKRSGVVA